MALSFRDVTGIDAGGIDVLHAVALKAHQMGALKYLRGEKTVARDAAGFVARRIERQRRQGAR